MINNKNKVKFLEKKLEELEAENKSLKEENYAAVKELNTHKACIRLYADYLDKQNKDIKETKKRYEEMIAAAKEAKVNYEEGLQEVKAKSAEYKQAVEQLIKNMNKQA